jgi:hypothetical protein
MVIVTFTATDSLPSSFAFITALCGLEKAQLVCHCLLFGLFGPYPKFVLEFVNNWPNFKQIKGLIQH